MRKNIKKLESEDQVSKTNMTELKVKIDSLKEKVKDHKKKYSDFKNKIRQFNEYIEQKRVEVQQCIIPYEHREKQYKDFIKKIEKKFFDLMNLIEQVKWKYCLLNSAENLMKEIQKEFKNQKEKNICLKDF